MAERGAGHIALLPDTRCPHESLASSDCPSLVSLVSLLESVPALLWETDRELRFTTLTGAALRFAGISRGACEGKTVEHLFAAMPDARRARRAHESALQGNAATFAAEVNGRDLHASVKPLRGADGCIAGAIGIALDMTERLVAERALRISEQSYRSLIEEAPYAICRCTASGELLQVNRAMSEMLGYDSAAEPELLLRDLPLIFSPAGSFAEFRRALHAAGTHPGADAVWIRRDGRPIQVRLGGRLVRNASGAVSHLDIFAENVTEKKRLEAELSQAQKMHAIGQLAGGVAHDFNNLLTVIIGHVGMLLPDATDPESRDSLEAVQGAAERAAALTKQLLAFSRRQMLRSQTVDPNDVIRNLLGMLARVIKENIELVFVPGEELGSVRADPGEIERVLLNLAVNAQDAMPDGGCLTIETSNALPDSIPFLPPDDPGQREYVQIAVRDTGFGMDRETQERVFDPFFTTKEPNEGTGLGLSVVYGVVRQSGGYIRLESEPGAGTTFRIFLPRVAPQEALPQPPVRAEAPPRGSETILLAEDDASIRRLVAGYLENLGYRVLTARDGLEAMKVAQSSPREIQLLLTDFIMPTVGGRELAARLTSVDPELKVVFISGYAGDASERDLEPAEGHFLQKPFSMDTLAKTVRGALDARPPARASASGITA